MKKLMKTLTAIILIAFISNANANIKGPKMCPRTISVTTCQYYTASGGVNCVTKDVTFYVPCVKGEGGGKGAIAIFVDLSNLKDNLDLRQGVTVSFPYSVSIDIGDGETAIFSAGDYSMAANNMIHTTGKVQ